MHKIVSKLMCKRKAIPTIAVISAIIYTLSNPHQVMSWIVVCLIQSTFTIFNYLKVKLWIEHR